MNRYLFPIILVAGALAGCTPATATPAANAASSPSPEPPVLTVMSHDSFSVSEPVVAAFEAANPVKVSFLKAGDTGAALNRAILSRQAPLADVFYGVDNTFLSRALEADIFEPYQPAGLQAVDAEFPLDGDLSRPAGGLSAMCASITTRPTSPRTTCLSRLPWRTCSRNTGPAGGGKPGHLLARAGFPAGDRRAFWRGRLPGFLGGAARQRRGGGERLGNGLLHQFQRLLRAKAPSRWWFPMLPARRRR